MASIYKLSIRNFRGIKAFDQFFYKQKFVCLIGRGDSGKSTILEAISYVLSSNWNITFYDSDFYNCNTFEPIIIEATLTDLPEYFFHERFGFFLQGIDVAKGGLIDDLELGDSEPAMTIRLEVKEDLEPVWTISNERNGSIVISASSRARLNTFLISDYSDRHFSWNKGNPLYSLYKLNDKEKEDKKDVIINALRQAKEKIDKEEFRNLQSVIDKIENRALQLGLNRVC
ncbi:AAA ATPase domain-containing protein [Tangfeifania diversioriginum]|uniref:AAA ATPase domain-containing protein n=1 Tax=Tangfeifania diversioriginum TaxID=1168035 RepID=A0A1M6FLE8_9BACT|nr:AAA family ATPase [Tangfeifania diversioriginum]SHI98469.1 AAA ATPase domain-containing protein [Tangfeifania diversioriginum]